jgi:RHH-type transcriptional regulator, rel operon repressor / antitoxin RelB
MWKPARLPPRQRGTTAKRTALGIQRYRLFRKIVRVQISAIRATMCTLHTTRRPSMATLSIRIPEEIGEQLEKLAESTGRTRSFLALDALRRYLAQEEWQAQAVRTAVERANSGTAKYADHDAVDRWLAGWGTDEEGDAPECK